MPDKNIAMQAIGDAYDTLDAMLSERLDPSELGLWNAVGGALGPVLVSPNDPVTQDRANEIGASLRALRDDLNDKGETELAQAEEDLHNLLSQALVDFEPDLDWYEAAGVTPPAEGEMTTFAGVKHKPEASED